MKTQTHVQSGGWSNHNQTLVCPIYVQAGLAIIQALIRRTQTHVKAGGTQLNHNQALVRSREGSLSSGEIADLLATATS